MTLWELAEGFRWPDALAVLSCFDKRAQALRCIHVVCFWFPMFPTFPYLFHLYLTPWLSYFWPSNSNVQVAKQFSSAAGYLTKANHVMWDVHANDVLVHPATPHLMLLDIFMQPDLMLGSLPRLGIKMHLSI